MNPIINIKHTPAIKKKSLKEEFFYFVIPFKLFQAKRFLIKMNENITKKSLVEPVECPKFY